MPNNQEDLEALLAKLGKPGDARRSISRAGFATAILFAFTMGGVTTATSIMYGLLPINIKLTDQASLDAPLGLSDAEAALLDDVAASFLDEVDASFASGATAMPAGRQGESGGYDYLVDPYDEAPAAPSSGYDYNQAAANILARQQNPGTKIQYKPDEPDALMSGFKHILSSLQTASTDNKLNNESEHGKHANLNNGTEIALTAFKITMLQAITLGIGFVIGFLFNRAGLKLWRIVVGSFFGSVVGWLAGVIIWAYVFISNGPTAAIVGGLPKSFLFAIVGTGIGVYFGRQKARNHLENTPSDSSAVIPAAQGGSGPSDGPQ